MKKNIKNVVYTYALRYSELTPLVEVNPFSAQLTRLRNTWTALLEF